MKTKTIIFATVLLTTGMLLAGCAKSGSSDWQHPATYQESVLALPDSATTPKQLAFKEKLRDFAMIPGMIEIEGHRLVVKASEEDFNKQGIDPIYKKYLQMSLDESNDGIEQWLKDSLITEEDIPRMLREAQAEFGKK